MNTCPEKLLLYRLWIAIGLIAAVMVISPDACWANKIFDEHQVVVISRNYVKTTPEDDGVVVESKKGSFEPVKFYGVTGTAAMLFIYNRVTRDKGVDLVLRAYEGRIDRPFAEEAVDFVLRFYDENSLVFQADANIRPNTNYGIARFRL